MDKTILYKFFEGTASFEEEETIKKWMEDSFENRKTLLKERKLFDAILLLGEKEGSKKTLFNHHSSLRTTLTFQCKLK